MNSLKKEFIKYLSDNYLERINNDINEKLVALNETGLLLRTEIADLSALDNDEIDFIFKIKTKSEVLTILGESKLYTLSLEYKCLLNNGIYRLTLIGIEESSKSRFTYHNSLTECFVPLNKKENHTKLATRFLKHYLKEDYASYPINVVKILDNIGLHPVLSTNIKDSLGKTIFNNCELELENDGKKTFIKKGSIIINIKNLVITKNEKLIRTTIIHECLHWHFHRKAFEIIMLLNNQYKYFDCLDYRMESNDPIGVAHAWMESQAYALTRACMMLESNVVPIIENMLPDVEKCENEGMNKIDCLYSIVSKLSDDFGCTMKDTIKRLVNLGYNEFGQLLNEYYGSIYDSVAQNEILGKHETRRIKQEIYDFMLENSPNLKMAIDSGLYVYADGFVVIKSPKYLIRIGNHYFLNTYARNHIEECSLVFNIKKEYQQAFNPTQAFNLMIANSGGERSTIIVGDTSQYVIADFMLPSVLAQDEPIKSHILKNSYIHEDGLSFSEYFQHLINKYGYTSVKDLMEATHCSRSVIENYRDYDDIGYSVEKVLSICAGMKLLPPESKNLIKKSGVIDLNSQSRRCKVYKKLVEDFWDKGIERWNKELKRNSIPVLYSD